MKRQSLVSGQVLRCKESRMEYFRGGDIISYHEGVLLYPFIAMLFHDDWGRKVKRSLFQRIIVILLEFLKTVYSILWNQNSANFMSFP